MPDGRMPELPSGQEAAEAWSVLSAYRECDVAPSRQARARLYRDDGTTSISYWSYWRGLQALANTAQDYRSDPARQYLRAVRQTRVIVLRDTGATREGRMPGMLSLPNFIKQAHAPGGALVGDAGHHKDPLVARGFSDAFRDAEL
jgi:hypothetical protein